jgi:hypothetical protein
VSILLDLCFAEERVVELKEGLDGHLGVVCSVLRVEVVLLLSRFRGLPHT